MDKFLIIDGNSLIYRAYYALPFLSNSKGIFTGAIYGFLNMFTKVLEEYEPTHVAVCFDFAHKTFRNEIFADYKGTRKPTPQELKIQFPILKEILNAMGVVYLEQEGVEADDLIGTLSKMPNCDKVILSGDRDVLQLISDETCVWLTKKGISEIHKVDEEELLLENFLKPYQIIELKALSGDNSDNIPGVKGIGPKSATNLIERFGNIENLYENLDSPLISKSAREKLIANKSNAFMSKKLATIKTDCDINKNFDDFKLTLPFSNECIEILRKYEFNSLLKKKVFLGEDAEKSLNNYAFNKNSKKKIVLIHSSAELKDIIEKNANATQLAFCLEGDMMFAFDSETTYRIKNELTLFSITVGFDEIMQALTPFFENPNILKICFDLKMHLHILEHYNINLKGSVYDLKLAGYLISGNTTSGALANEYFDYKAEFIDLISKNNMETLYNEIEIPLIYVLYDMEKNGFKLDVDELNRLWALYDAEIKEITLKIYELAGEEFNINSPKQISEILFKKLKLPDENNKKHSTGVDMLTQIEDTHEIVPLILRYRKVNKIKTTYLDSYKSIIAQNGDIIHTIFNQMLTSTGRLSSSEPNLQNIPVRNDEGKALRRMFISRFENGQIVGADYNQIELRLLAHFSQDEKLIDAFNSNKDIHRITASEIFEVEENEVTTSQRRQAKAVNFGIIYGISEFGLSNNVGISKRSAKEYIEKYFETYPKVKEYMDNNIKFAKENGFITTIFNRKRKIPEINSAIYLNRAFGERVAMNMPLQGSASDIIKIAMIKVYNKMKERNLKSKLVLQIHDELIVDSHPSETEEIKNILKECMENVISLKVPLLVDVQSGPTWFDA